MLVIAIETAFLPGGRVRWAGRRHDEDWPDASSGNSPAGLFDAVFGALHDGEQVALGLDCALSMPVSADRRQAAAGPGLTELGHLLDELGTWRPWTRVSTSLARWRANTSMLVWQAVPAPPSGEVAATAAADSFFRQLGAATVHRGAAGHMGDVGAGTVVNLAAAAARRAGLLVDESELSWPVATIETT
jgi:hypothetical protein